MSNFERLWEGGPLFAQAEHFRLGTDCVLLADFAYKVGTRRGTDLGCASGSIMLLMLANNEKIHMTGLEILPEAAALAEENMSVNAFADRSRIVTGDIRRHRELFRSGEFDFVVANPPYFPVNSGAAADDPGRAGARGEFTCTLEDICTAASYLCKTGGSFYMVHKPERLSEVMCCMSRMGLEPKRLRLVSPREGAAPNLILIEGKRGGKPGLKIEPPLILTDPNGGESTEVKRIYHR